MKASGYVNAVAVLLPEKEPSLSTENKAGLSPDVVLIQLQSKMVCPTRNQLPAVHYSCLKGRKY
jgi:hypothetical protein